MKIYLGIFAQSRTFDPNRLFIAAGRSSGRLNLSNPCGPIYRVSHFEVNISAPRLDLESKAQQILTLAWERLIWDFQPLGVKAKAISVDFSDALDVKPVHQVTLENGTASDCCLSLTERMSAREIHHNVVATLGPGAVS
jgi:hypothetical protein